MVHMDTSKKPQEKKVAADKVLIHFNGFEVELGISHMKVHKVVKGTDGIIIREPTYTSRGPLDICCRNIEGLRTSGLTDAQIFKMKDIYRNLVYGYIEPHKNVFTF